MSTPTVKLRSLDTSKALSPAELEVINKNYWIIENALNSVGAASPIGTVSPPITIITRHNQLQGLDADDHLQYLKVEGRGEQAKTFVIENRTSDPASPITGQLWLRTDL